MKNIKGKIIIGILTVSCLGNIGLLSQRKHWVDQAELLTTTYNQLVDVSNKYKDLQESFDNLQSRTTGKSSSSSNSTKSSSNTLTLKGDCYKIYTNKSSIESQIKKAAKEKWGTEYDMVKYEQDKQLKAYHNVLGHIGQMDQDILNDALGKWGIEFDMVVYEYNKQVDAKNSL